MFLKVFSDLCVIFAVLGPFPEVIVYHSSLLLPAVLCAFGAGIAAGLQNSGKGSLRWLGAAFPALALYLSWVTGGFGIVLAAAVYTVVVILWGRLHLEYYSFCHSFQTSLRIVGIWYVLLWILALLKETPVKDFEMIHEEIALGFGLVHCFTGVILQRQLRLGGDAVAKGSRLQMAVVLIGTGSAIAAFIAAMPALRKGIAAVIHAVVLAVVSLMSLRYDSFMEDYAARRKMWEEETAKTGTAIIQPNWQEIIPRQPQVDKEPSYWWIVPVVAFAILAAFLLLRAFGRKSVSVSTEETVGQIDTPDRNKDTRRTNRGKVRHYYREYLRHGQKRGLTVRKYDTSGDILEKTPADTDREAAAALRQIYLRARYDETGEVTAEQAEEARALLKKIRSGKNTD
jgi:hypothetical protein